MSREPSEIESGSPVYDFMYCDTRRVGSFLAQFNPAGNLTAQRRTTSQNRNLGGDVSGGVDIKVFKGATSANASFEAGHQSEETYDPFWTGAISLLDHLAGRGLLKRDLWVASIGQLVLLSGNLQILDLRVPKAAWEVPMLAAKFGIGDTAQMTRAQIEENSLGMEIIKLFPHTIQARLVCSTVDDIRGSASWMTLNPDAMVVPPEDIILKYGHWIPGEWKALAIKDADFDAGPNIDKELENSIRTQGWEKTATERHSTGMSMLAEILAPYGRKVLGRPGAFFGVTPIMIFREVLSA
jgi:hypothetical protein